MKFLSRFPYWYLIAIPALIFGLGVASNQAVLIANHGKFPVMLNEAQVARRCQKDENIPAVACGNGGQFIDYTHSIMGSNSHLKFLSDIWPLGATYSIGDGLIELGSWLFGFCPYMWLALTIRKFYVMIQKQGE